LPALRHGQAFAVNQVQPRHDFGETPARFPAWRALRILRGEAAWRHGSVPVQCPGRIAAAIAMPMGISRLDPHRSASAHGAMWGWRFLLNGSVIPFATTAAVRWRRHLSASPVGVSQASSQRRRRRTNFHDHSPTPTMNQSHRLRGGRGWLATALRLAALRAKAEDGPNCVALACAAAEPASSGEGGTNRPCSAAGTFSRLTRAMTRCTTLVKLLVALSGGSRAKRAPEAGRHSAHGREARSEGRLRC
jgi:hypothetical protein